MKQNRSVAGQTLERLFGETPVETTEAELQPGESLVLPVVEEQAEIRKEQVERGKVRIETRVTEHTEVIDEPFLQEDVTVERVPIHRRVNAPLPIRYEGDTMIVPLLEEVVVVTKELMLKEELRITRRKTTVHQPQEVTLRREEAHIHQSHNGHVTTVKPSPRDRKANIAQDTSSPASKTLKHKTETKQSKTRKGK